MKLYIDYKKLFNIILFFVILFMPFGIFLPFRFIASEAILYAQNAIDVQNKIDKNNSDIQKLEQEISLYQGQLDSLSQQKSSLNNSLKQLDLTRKKLNAEINVTQSNIEKTNLTIKNISMDIGNKENSIKNNLDSIRLEIRNTDEFEQQNIVESILSESDFSATWNDLDNIVTVRERLRADIIKLKQAKDDLENTRNISISAKNKLLALNSQLSDQKKIVLQNANEKNKLLKQTKDSESSYQKLLKDRIAKRDAFEKEVRSYESQLQFILDPSKLPQKGVLSWPLQKVFITQMFGKTVDAKRLYVSGSHNGVDFRASVGTPVMAMADGTVLGTGNTDLTCSGASFGKFVFIQYNNGLSSTYGHLSLIKTSIGNSVKRGEIVGYSGSTGYATGPHLHVSLYASQAVKMDSRPSTACNGRVYTMPIAPVDDYLDPMDYLPTYQP